MLGRGVHETAEDALRRRLTVALYLPLFVVLSKKFLRFRED